MPKSDCNSSAFFCSVYVCHLSFTVYVANSCFGEANGIYRSCANFLVSGGYYIVTSRRRKRDGKRSIIQVDIHTQTPDFWTMETLSFCLARDMPSQCKVFVLLVRYPTKALDLLLLVVDEDRSSLDEIFLRTTPCLFIATRMRQGVICHKDSSHTVRVGDTSSRGKSGGGYRIVIVQ
jgi:hypothetical protein